MISEFLRLLIHRQIIIHISLYICKELASINQYNKSGIVMETHSYIILFSYVTQTI